MGRPRVARALSASRDSRCRVERAHVVGCDVLMLPGGHVDRRVWPAVHAALDVQPAVAVTGPRTSGKTTLARRIVADRGGTFLDLDDPAIRTLAEDDPTAFVHDLVEPVVVDEFQRVPAVLAAVKAELNVDRRPGRYVLTGSARHQVVPELSDYLTGRVDLQTLWPFAMAELNPATASIVDRLFDQSLIGQRRTSALDRAAIVDLVLRGGYPIAVTLEAPARGRWLRNLATLVVERAGDDAGSALRPDALRRFLQLSAVRTARVLNVAEIGRDAGLGRDQASEYMRVLELVYLVLRLPAWSVNLTSRVTKRAKLHLVDTGLAAQLQGAVAERLAPTDPVGATRFGALLETFVVTEIVKQLGWSSLDVEPYHFRTADDLEVDLVLEAADGRVVAVEVKAGSRVTPAATTGLTYLRDRLGDRFIAGVVLNTGQHAQQLGDRLAVAPIDSLWS